MERQCEIPPHDTQDILYSWLYICIIIEVEGRWHTCSSGGKEEDGGGQVHM